MSKYLIEDEIKIKQEMCIILAKRFITWKDDTVCPPKRFHPQVCREGKIVPNNICMNCVLAHIRHLATSNLKKRGVTLNTIFSSNQ